MSGQVRAMGQNLMSTAALFFLPASSLHLPVWGGSELGSGARRLVAVPELLIAANILSAFKPSPFWGRFLPFEVCFPSLGSLGCFISLSQLCSQCMPKPLGKLW